MKSIGKYDLAVSIGNTRFLDKNGFEDMRSSGIKGIELSFNDYSGVDFKSVKKIADDCGIALWSLHLPFMPFDKIDISSTDSKMREENIAFLCDLISESADIGINRFVIHASGEPVLPPVRSERIKCSKDSLYKLSEFAKKYNAVIAVENLPRTCLGNCCNEINELTSVNDNLLVCFDTNHLLCETADDFVKNLNKKIETVHISDYDFVGEKHWLPGYGKVDWNEITSLLDSKQYVGPWLYEISFSPKNLPDKTEITFDDIYGNYCDLFNVKKDFL